MNSLRFFNILCLNCIGSVFFGVANAANPEDTATALAVAAGVKTGLCAIPDAGDGSLAAAFAKKGFVVWASNPDAGKFEAARLAQADSGLLGRSLYLETSRPGNIALADRSADLVILNVSNPALLQSLTAAEVLRVLSPYNGVALIGPLSTANEPAIKEWAKSLPGVTGKEVAGTRWLMARRGALEGGQPWSHWFCTPDNNPVSADSAFDLPTEIQWLGKPYSYPRHVGCRVAANGRVFVMIGASGSAGVPDDMSDADGKTHQIVARSIFNGSVLWRRPIDKDRRVLQSAMVADGDRLWLADGQNVLLLDAATGEEKMRVPVGKEGESCKWIALSGGILTALAGANDPPETYFGDYSKLL